MEIESLFGLPAHPLVVHAAVVLVPLTAIGALLCLYPPIRRHLAVAVFVLSILSTVSVALAQGSGEELQHDVRKTELVHEHAEMGETLLPWVIVLMVGSAGLVGLEYAGRLARDDEDTDGSGDGRRGLPAWTRWAFPVVAIVLVIGAAMSVERVLEIGHSGAKATWSEVQASGTGG